MAAKNRWNLPIVLYSIAEIGRFLQSEPGGHCLTQKPFFSFLLNDTGQGVSIHVKSPSRLKHIRPKIPLNTGQIHIFGESSLAVNRHFRTIKTCGIFGSRTFSAFKVLLFAFIDIFTCSVIGIESIALWTRALVTSGQIRATVLTCELIVTFIDIWKRVILIKIVFLHAKIANFSTTMTYFGQKRSFNIHVP